MSIPPATKRAFVPTYEHLDASMAFFSSTFHQYQKRQL